MPYNPVPKKQFNSNFKKNEWLQLPVGSSQVRILDETPLEIQTHYVNSTYIKCLGEDCPVCKNNRIIFKTNPTDYKKVKGYASRNTRFFANVFDRTPVKICPSCGAEVKKAGAKFPNACSNMVVKEGSNQKVKCDTILTEVKATPLNKVKIWGWGVENQDRLAGFYASEVDDDGTPIPLTNYDFMILVTPAANDKKTTTPSPRVDLNDEVKVEEKDLFNLTTAVISLTAEEIVQFMKGVQLRDLFNARKAEAEEKYTKDFIAEEDLEDDIDSMEDNIKKLFEE
jgi:hypothetical protein